MKVSGLIKLLKTTVLKQISVKDDDILTFINLALIQVYKKFSVSTKEQAINIYDDIHIYKLGPDVLNPTMAFTQEKYLKDLDGDEVVSSGGSSEVVEIGINDENDINSIFTPSPGEMMVTYPTTGQVIAVIYKASPDTIESDELDNLLVLPDQYIEPLLMYVGYLAFLSTGTSLEKGEGFLVKYNIACASLTKLGITNPDNTSNHKLIQKGFP